MTIMKKQPCLSPSTAPPSPSPLGMHKHSQSAISKVKPKIRIIHIFAPEIIKTDVANFRELVQRLTGKPTEQDHHHHRKKSSRKEPVMMIRRSEDDARPNTSETKKMELESLEQRVKTEEEEEMMTWNNNNGANSGGFLGGFQDLDGFFQEIEDHEFPFMNITNGTNYHHPFEEAQLA